MSRKLIAALLFAFAILSGTIPSFASADAPPVIVIQIKGEIDAGQVAVVHRAMVAATEKQAQAIVLEIDTFGGLVDSAVKIRDMISDSPLPTICYIKSRAWSAGALIAISHRHIVMAPGASIGAAEPIPTTEKTIAAVKAEFSATAGKTGRNPRVAEAMVDKSLGLPGYAEPGQILALTETQAMKVGYAELIAADRTAVLVHYNLAGAPVEEYKAEWSDRMAAWLSDPTVKSILLGIIFLAVMTEIKTAGMGVAGLIGLVAALLFFGSQWLTGVAGVMEILLFVGGVVLVILELHAPGVGIFGLPGIICIIASFFFTLGGDAAALNILAASMVGAVVLFALIVKRLPSSRLWAKFVLKDSETAQAGFVSALDYSPYVGREGTAVTFLRPAGTAEIDGQYLDVVSEGQFIKLGTAVKVVSVNGSRIVVRRMSDDGKETLDL
jgi:membrane-bound serine protease (ClpP class)